MGKILHQLLVHKTYKSECYLDIELLQELIYLIFIVGAITINQINPWDLSFLLKDKKYKAIINSKSTEFVINLSSNK